MKSKFSVLVATLVLAALYTCAIIASQPQGKAFAQNSPGTGYKAYSNTVVGTVLTVKGTAGQLQGYEILNSAATICYLQIFDVATATTVTLGTTVPTAPLGFPAGAAGNVSDLNLGFVNGIKIAATTTRTGLTACGTAMDVTLFYK